MSNHPAPFCQSCCDPCGPWPDGGYELQDGSDFWICDACWGKMSVFERAKLRIEVRELTKMDALHEIMEAMRKLREAEDGGNEPWRESL